MRLRFSLLPLLAVMLAPAIGAFAAATITIWNDDAAGTGLNDPTPVSPVGGNTGTTLGQQRSIAFQHAANVWGAAVTSTQPINILASWASGASLCHPGYAAGFQYGGVAVNFAGAPFPNTFYPLALARKITGTNLGSSAADFTLRTCLPASSYYLGLDNNHGAQVDLVSALVHEIAHGLGFWNVSYINGGPYLAGLPSPWDYFLLDTTTGKLWSEMSDAERTVSARNQGAVVWTGANATAAAALVLGAPVVEIGGPEAGATAGLHAVGTATFGAQPGATPVLGQLMPAIRDSGGAGGACVALAALDALAVAGNVALFERGVCADVVLAKNLQNAGAIGAILIHNAATTPPPGPTGSDPTVVIPTVALSQADGDALRTRLFHRARRSSGVTASLELDLTQHPGTDPAGRVIVYTPTAFQASAGCHWDPSLTPNQLMEPTLAPELAHAVDSLTLGLLQDIGW